MWAVASTGGYGRTQARTDVKYREISGCRPGFRQPTQRTQHTKGRCRPTSFGCLKSGLHPRLARSIFRLTGVTGAPIFVEERSTPRCGAAVDTAPHLGVLRSSHPTSTLDSALVV